MYPSMITAKPFKKATEAVLRRIGLEPLIYHYVGWKDRRRNAQRDQIFMAANPGLILPPAQLRFDVIACSNAEYYSTTGTKMASQIQEVINRFSGPGPKTVCEWGCGPGRILFALEKLKSSSEFDLIGCDAFAPSIHWAQSVPDTRIQFLLNHMTPPLALADSSVDFVYAVSVFTHLSERLTRQWFGEIMRVLKPGGVFWFSTHGGTHHRNELDQVHRANSWPFQAGTTDPRCIPGSIAPRWSRHLSHPVAPPCWNTCRAATTATRMRGLSGNKWKIISGGR